MPEDLSLLPLERWCEVPVYSLKLSFYDPEIICAFERLRKTRKQAAYTHEALKYFLSTEKGVQVLSLMEGKTSAEPCPAIITFRSDTPFIETPAERVVAKNYSTVTQQNERSSVLSSILE
jgi:hypothetical protein